MGNAAFLPTLHQGLLLRACLLEGEDAVAAWQTWRASTKLDQIDGGSTRLLPLLADKLQRLNLHDAAFDIYRGVQRRSWARNQILFHAAAHIVRQLEAEKIAVMALKGIVLASVYYDEMSLRPMNDVDLLIRREDAEKAVRILEQSGSWTRSSGFSPREPADFAVQPSCAFTFDNNAEVEIDLHWRLFRAYNSAQADAALWERARPFEIAAARCVAPSTTDMLLHVVAHGLRWNSLPGLRWAVDATMLIRRAPVDWVYFSEQARRRGLGDGLGQAFGYLREVLQAPIPEETIEAFNRLRSRPIGRLIYQSELRPPTRQTLLMAFFIHCHVARRELVCSQGLGGYLHYFRALRRGRSLREIALWVWRRLAAGLQP
jgi:hypothetical protein